MFYQTKLQGWQIYVLYVYNVWHVCAVLQRYFCFYGNTMYQIWTWNPCEEMMTGLSTIIYEETYSMFHVLFHISWLRLYFTNLFHKVTVLCCMCYVLLTYTVTQISCTHVHTHRRKHTHMHGKKEREIYSILFYTFAFIEIPQSTHPYYKNMVLEWQHQSSNSCCRDEVSFVSSYLCRGRVRKQIRHVSQQLKSKDQNVF